MNGCLGTRKRPQGSVPSARALTGIDRGRRMRKMARNSFPLDFPPSSGIIMQVPGRGFEPPRAYSSVAFQATAAAQLRHPGY
jgi:hypothetical protein